MSAMCPLGLFGHRSPDYWNISSHWTDGSVQANLISRDCSIPDEFAEASPESGRFWFRHGTPETVDLFRLKTMLA
jgi:hypothetical protein